VVPEVSEVIIEDYIQPSKTYYLDENTVNLQIDGYEAIKQTIHTILTTEKGSNIIYDPEFGVSLEQYIGVPVFVIVADIEYTLRNALMWDSRIYDVKVTNIEETGIDSLTIDFTVYTEFGTVNETLSIG
jgi:phage baseplate assembly protein W